MKAQIKVWEKVFATQGMNLLLYISKLDLKIQLGKGKKHN
jgi:hypothetical protein